MSADLEKLLPCPFCGGEAKPIQQTPWSWRVCCTDGCWVKGPTGSDKAAAISLWNTRALTDDNAALRAKAEKLAEALRQIVEKDDAGDMMYRADGPFAQIARAALTALDTP